MDGSKFTYLLIGFLLKGSSLSAREYYVSLAGKDTEARKNRPSRAGQFDLTVREYLPEGNRIGAPLYRNEPAYDLVPEELSEVERGRFAGNMSLLRGMAHWNRSKAPGENRKDKREECMKNKCFFFLGLFCLYGWGAKAVCEVARLTCEQIENPLGIAVPCPELGWNLVAAEKDVRQQAYEIRVSDDLFSLDRDGGNMWESGKVESSESLHIVYQGKELRPFTRYYWKVRVYDSKGQISAWSKAAWFETAMLAPSDWTAQWIGDGRKQFGKDEDFYGDDPMPLFRKEFSVGKKLVSARFYICGLGYHEAWINGVRIRKIVEPVDYWQTEAGTYIVDMGVNFAGVARIRVKGPRAPADAIQEDCYILGGKGLEEYMPRFTFHGFRYVEVSGWPGRFEPDNIEGICLSADLETDGVFSCSNELLNRLHEVTKRTFLSNLFSVQSDCPGREKMGYGGDMVATAESFIFNFDMGAFYRKTVCDFINDQTPEGGMTEIAPYTGIADRGIGGESGPLGWQLAFPYLQKQLYDFYGDKRIIEASYPAFVRQMDFIQSRAIDGLFHWDIGDHVALDPRAEAFSACAFYYAHASLIAEFAEILGKTGDAERYRRLAGDIRQAIIRKYLIPGTGRFDNATQGAQVFALYYGLTPEPERSFDVLLREYARHDWHVSTGIFACKMAFDVLRRADRNDVAYRLVNREDYPGWGYMLAKGATTLWESWEYPENGSSQNHPMFGSTEEWMYRSLLGINPGKPGFAEVIVKPQPVGDLVWVKGSYHSVRGRIVSDWKIEKGVYTLTVEIPANTTGLVYVKGRKRRKCRRMPGRAGRDGKTGMLFIAFLRASIRFRCLFENIL